MATEITCPMVGKIVKVDVKVGDKVGEDDQVAILEAMKMEMPIVSPAAGTIKEILVEAGQEVEADTVIATLE
ncbi:MAG TPA: acetyl-CoA carboxylase biotin carboxyl carrier protein subunit [Deltaproteobacteria bacterium]|jgi:biotin carboxyl carrier protein|nr:acetyl-CoA carboxylase biotin carboxyl carrier protein subunit [Deltaproteobacteria bacterium]